MSDTSVKDTIRWTSNYLVGVQEIDQEHQGLFSLAEKLHSAMLAGKGPEIVNKLLAELVDYTCYHFAHEESLMQRIGYPYFQKHCREHEELRMKVMEMKKDEADLHTASKLMHLLVDWLKCHTTTSDRRIGSYMRTRGLIS